MIKAAFFDIDGTLLSFITHRVSPGTIRAFDALHRQGIRTFLSTGRPPILVPQFPVSFEGGVYMNGGYCTLGSQVLVKNPIHREESRLWLQYAIQNDLCTMVFTDSEMFVNKPDDPVGVAIHRQLQFQMPPFRPTAQLLDLDIYQIIAIMPAWRDAEVQDLLPHCAMPRWHDQFTDMVAAGNSKASGIEAVISRLGITAEECIAFGDGGNDIEMLDYCGIGVAMGNAADSVKAHADHVTTSVDDEGIETALRTLGII